MESLDISGYHLSFFCAEGSEKLPLIYLNASAEEAEELAGICRGLCSIVSISGLDWNRDLSPWPAPGVFGRGQDFSGGARQYLRLLIDKLIPQAEKHIGYTPLKRGIAGYSLGGLFAVYCVYNSSLFTLAASVSGSLWFDGWLDYMRAHIPQSLPERIYFSVGSSEKKARNPRMRPVEDCARAACDIFSALGCRSVFEVNPGGHFKDTAQRLATALVWLSKIPSAG